ncbi:hypothetical protein J4E91_011268 [Alternaria rosae]|nr:hypothetical protein J4E91_011268 [Alternaria rosae]
MNDDQADTRQGAKRTSEKLHPGSIPQESSSSMNYGAYTSDVNHYDWCNLIMENILRRLGELGGCAPEYLEVNERLREFAMKLENWKNSIRWSATGGHSTGSLAGDESKARCLLSELKQSNHELFQTIQGSFVNFSQSFANVMDVLTGEPGSDSSRLSDVLKELEISGKFLAKQLRPIGTYARDVFLPRQLPGDATIADLKTLGMQPRNVPAALYDAQTSSTSAKRDSTTASPEGSEDVPRKRPRLESHISESQYTSVSAKGSIKQVESTPLLGDISQPLLKCVANVRVKRVPLIRITNDRKDAERRPSNEGHQKTKVDSRIAKNDDDADGNASHERRPRSRMQQFDDKARVKSNVRRGKQDPDHSLIHVLKRITKKIKGLYVYSTIGPKQVRLLVIKPGKEDDDIDVILQVVDDDQLGTDDYCYEALSYHCDEGKHVHSIIIRDGWNTEPIKHFYDAVLGAQNMLHGRRLYVRPSLYSALKTLRSQDRHVALWVDALCIDQKNDAEKTMQVLKMNRIYRKAYNVCIWLGMDDLDFHSSKAMAFIKDVVDVEKLENLLTSGRWIPQWASLLHLLKRSWFSRRWAFLELASAQEASVHCGRSQVHWDDFRDAIGTFHRHFKSLRPSLENSEFFKSPVSDMELLRATLLVEITSGLFRRKPHELPVSTISLEKLVSQLPMFETCDPRDTIYSLHNLSKELNAGKSNRSYISRKLPPAPDYAQDLFEVYRDFVEWVVEDSKSLDIICRHWAQGEQEVQCDTHPAAASRLVTLPSWILTVEDKSYRAGEAVFRGCKADDSLVGLPGGASYSASGHTLPSVKFGKQRTKGSYSLTPGTPPLDIRANHAESPHDYSLTVKGYLIGQIGWTSGDISAGIIPQRGLEKLGWTQREYGEANTVPDQLYRTLVADRGPNGASVPTYYSRACSYCLLNETPNGHIDINELLDNDYSTTTQSIVKDYLERVRAVTWNKVLLQAQPATVVPLRVSQDNSMSRVSPESSVEHLVGLGPTNTEVHDIIAIFLGCSVPVILRPLRDCDPVEYILLGEAFIYGMMDGESVDLGYQERDIKLW